MKKRKTADKGRVMAFTDQDRGKLVEIPNPFDNLIVRALKAYEKHGA